ncbi:MAG: hypothetical protein M5U28_36095 [Sandaracinaceae bacterium]|nr:hypothetical protein [Sandaracinaceae bacterium]
MTAAHARSGPVSLSRPGRACALVCSVSPGVDGVAPHLRRAVDAHLLRAHAARMT